MRLTRRGPRHHHGLSFSRMEAMGECNPACAYIQPARLLLSAQRPARERHTSTVCTRSTFFSGRFCVTGHLERPALDEYKALGPSHPCHSAQTWYVKCRIERSYLHTSTSLPLRRGSSNGAHGDPVGMHKLHDLACAAL
jgi:hypothetical protein